jgi:hypothetical protein
LCDLSLSAGVTALADAISSNEALLVLDISNNNIGEHIWVDGWESHDGEHFKYCRKIDGKYDFANELPEGCGLVGVTTLANAIRDNGALSKLDASDNSMFGKKDKAGITAWADALKASTSITELNLAKNGINANDTKILAPALSDNAAISSVNVLFNDIGAEQAHALANVLKEHATLKSLCGNKGNETELDMSGKKIGADGAIMLAPEIADNGAILQFTFSGDSYDSTPVAMETSMVEANFGGKGLGSSGAIMVAAFLPKCT